jgi:hypothetical protein
VPPATSMQALGYALLIHIRVLGDFFFSRHTSFDDCHVCHFKECLSPEMCPTPIRTQKIVDLGTALNKFLVHFTSTRWEQQRRSWNFYDEFTPVLEDLIVRFESALPQDIRQHYERGYQEWKRKSPMILPS